MTILTNEQVKQKIAKSFGQAASRYNAHADLQRECVSHLLNLLRTYQFKLPEGSVLEIGCGTGFITQGLLNCFPKRSLEITDFSTEMLNYCQANLNISDEQKSLISFYQLDAENIPSHDHLYAAIIGGFVIQWFSDPIKSLNRLLKRLHPDGMLFVSFPTCDSFSEWRQLCNQLNFPFTANPLPDPETLLSALPYAQLGYATTLELTTTHANAADFFRSLKAIGAGINRSQQQLTATQMKTLIQHWDAQAAGPVQVHHQIVCWALQRKSS
jgi:malonyl-CoA O-methyltransferase